MDTRAVLRPAPNIASAGVALSSATSGNMGGVFRKRDVRPQRSWGFRVPARPQVSARLASVTHTSVLPKALLCSVWTEGGCGVWRRVPAPCGALAGAVLSVGRCRAVRAQGWAHRPGLPSVDPVTRLFR